ncbi:hypothetical protein FHS42_006336 [Streptomyces zagrosensis]|uniref:Transposase IS110-like N-terminal domain-containing protein n=1 Tax=Streptomyces zagrosensis TaxID=1042984 RepID=A0A7W9V1F7_9ACTN|nr:hypothetical protein [Streptomyces zagrosensis]
MKQPSPAPLNVQRVVYITGLAVHPASTAYRGQDKTDEKDAFVIAD